MARPKKRKTPRGPRPGGRGAPPAAAQLDLLAQAQKMQEEMDRIQEALAEEVLEVSVGGGAVRVEITGQQQVRAIEIDPELLDPEEVDMLQDMLVAAINQAIEKSQALAAERMQAVMGNFSLGGMSFPGLL